MLEKVLKKCLSIEYEKKILIWDYENFYEYYESILQKNNFVIWKYEDVEEFRKFYEETIRDQEECKVAVIVQMDVYVPFDVRQALYEIRIGYDSLFPNLNKKVLQKNKRDLELISCAYDKLYESLLDEEATSNFLEKVVFSKENIRKYYSSIRQQLEEESRVKYQSEDWMRLAKLKAVILFYAAKTGCDELFDPFPELDLEFEQYINNEYSMLSGKNPVDYPIMLPKIMQNFVNADIKTALIVMDGMSLFDFEILVRSFSEMPMEERESFAMVPTVTSISRQSLMAGEYPVKLENPFSLSKEEKQFIENGKNLGYRESQIQYTRGYSFEMGPSIKLLGIIINEVDDIMHGQHQGRIGMYNDVQQMAKNGELVKLVENLRSQGFQILITADHGNTVCTGTGSFKGFGVDTKTRSKRMLIIKDYAEVPEKMKDKLIEYKGFYIDKQYQYFVCKKGITFDNQGESVVTHGGITMEEVIVPFIKIKAVQ